MDLLLKSGIFGILIILIFSLLLVTGVVVVAITRSRRALITFALLALSPLILGVLGTCIGNMLVSKDTQRFPANPEAARAMETKARREAWMPTYLGSGATVALLMVGGCGIAFTKKSNTSWVVTGDNVSI
jgi:hypothetical protein